MITLTLGGVAASKKRPVDRTSRRASSGGSGIAGLLQAQQEALDATRALVRRAYAATHAVLAAAGALLGLQEHMAASAVLAAERARAEDLRALGFEPRRHLVANLQLSVFLNAQVTRTIAVGALVVDDAQGRTHYDYWRYDREVSVEFFDRKRGRTIHAEVVRRRRRDEVQRSLRIRVRIVDPSTGAKEAHGYQGQIAGWGLDASSNFAQRIDRGLSPAYGNSTTVVELQIGDRGLKRLLSQEQGAYFAAYAREVAADQGELPLWTTEEGRNTIRDQPNRYQQERRELNASKEFTRHMTRLASEPTTRERQRALKWIAGSARRDLYAVGALVRLVPPAERTLEASIVGRGIRVVDSQQGARAIDVFRAE